MRIVISFLLILLTSFSISSSHISAKYIDNDPNLIWKDVSDKVYLNYSMHHTSRNTVMLVKSPMSDWEFSYGDFNPSEIVEVDLDSGEVLQTFYIPEYVYILFCEINNETRIIAFSDKKVMIYDKGFNKIFELTNLNLYLDSVRIINNDILRVSDKYYRLDDFQEISAEMIDIPSELRKYIKVKNNILLIGDTYELNNEDAEIVVDLTKIEAEGNWDYDYNPRTSNSTGYIILVSNSKINYLLYIDYDGNVLKAIPSLSSEFLSFQNYIINYSTENEYWVIDKESFEVIRKIPTNNNDHPRFFGKVINNEYLSLENNNSFDLYDNEFNLILHYEGKDVEGSELKLTDKYFYSLYTVVNRTTLKPVYHLPVRFKVFGDYAVHVDLKHSHIKGGARIYKIPDYPTENIVTVSKDKVWRITFNKNINDKNSFHVLQSTGEFSGYPTVNIEENIVYIHPPKNGYNPGLYYLYIHEDMRSADGVPLNEEVFYPFVVK